MARRHRASQLTCPPLPFPCCRSIKHDSRNPITAATAHPPAVPRAGVIHTPAGVVGAADMAAVYTRTICIYPLETSMTKRLIDVEDEVLEAARRVLGTGTIKDTVNTALRATVQAAERRQRVDVAALRRFAEASRDLLDEDVMADAWR